MRSSDRQQLHLCKQLEGAKQTSLRRVDILSTIKSAGRENIIFEIHWYTWGKKQPLEHTNRNSIFEPECLLLFNIVSLCAIKILSLPSNLVLLVSQDLHDQNYTSMLWLLILLSHAWCACLHLPAFKAHCISWMPWGG